MLRNRILPLILTGVMGLAPALAEAAKSSRPKKEPPFSIKGEVVDLARYLPDGKLHGAEHAEASRQGIEAGNPPGLLSKGGKVYLVLGRNLKPANDQLAPFAGKQVKITGKRATKEGVAAVIVEQIEELPPAAKPKPKSGKSSRS